MRRMGRVRRCAAVSKSTRTTRTFLEDARCASRIARPSRRCSISSTISSRARVSGRRGGFDFFGFKILTFFDLTFIFSFFCARVNLSCAFYIFYLCFFHLCFDLRFFDLTFIFYSFVRVSISCAYSFFYLRFCLLCSYLCFFLYALIHFLFVLMRSFDFDI